MPDCVDPVSVQKARKGSQTAALTAHDCPRVGSSVVIDATPRGGGSDDQHPALSQG
jgi:hypothetical protein